MRDQKHIQYIEALERFNIYPEVMLDKNLVYHLFEEIGIDYSFEEFIESNEGAEIRKRFIDLNKSIEAFKELSKQNYKDSDLILKSFEKKIDALENNYINDFNSEKEEYANKLYETALSLAENDDINSLKQASDILKSLSGWKDSSIISEEYDEKIEEQKRSHQQKKLQEKEIRTQNERYLRRSLLLLLCIGVIIYGIYYGYMYKYAAPQHIARGDELFQEHKYQEALIEYEQAGGFQDSKEKIKETIKKYVSGLNIRSCITIGRYEQDDYISNGAEPIAWIVLDKKDDKVLLVSTQILDYLEWHPTKVDGVNNGAKQFLNDNFYMKAFTPAERTMILDTSHKVTVYKEERPYRLTEQYEEIEKNKFFLLNYNDVNNYFNTEQRKCNATLYAADKSYSKNSYYPWILRDESRIMGAGSQHIYSRGSVSYIDSDGTLSSITYNYGTSTKFGIRPAMWIGIE